MGCGGKTEESDGRPRIIRKQRVHVRYQHDRHYTESADKERKLSTGVDAVAVFHAEAGEPTSCDRANAGSGIDDNEGVFDVG